MNHLSDYLEVIKLKLRIVPAKVRLIDRRIVNAIGAGLITGILIDGFNGCAFF